MWAQKSVCRSATYKLALLHALLLTTAPWQCHRRVIRLAPEMLPATLFSVKYRFGAAGRNLLQWSRIRFEQQQQQQERNGDQTVRRPLTKYLI